MANDASMALGSSQLAGTFVNPRGFARQATATVAGGVVGAFAAAATAPSQGDVPKFGRVAFVAVTDEEIAIVKTKSGLLKMKVSNEVLARRDRGEISAVELKRGKLLSGLTVQFNDGAAWSFDVPKANQRTATQVVEILGGAVQ